MGKFLPHLTLSGSAWTGVSINDCVAQARYLAQTLTGAIKNHQF